MKVPIQICFDFEVAICEAIGLGQGRMDRVWLCHRWEVVDDGAGLDEDFLLSDACFKMKKSQVLKSVNIGHWFVA